MRYEMKKKYSTFRFHPNLPGLPFEAAVYR